MGLFGACPRGLALGELVCGRKYFILTLTLTLILRYVEALHWAVTKGITSPPDGVTIDGLYLDGFNYDRVGIRRVRKVLPSANPNNTPNPNPNRCCRGPSLRH